MRKIVFAAVISAVATLPTVTMADNSAVQCEKVSPTINQIRANLHANYMPNFLPMLTNSQKELGLSGEQCAAINQFRKDKASKGKMVIKKIIQLEKEAGEAAFKGASMEEILKRNQEIQALRTKIVEGKMNCHHGFVKKLLTEQQYIDLKERIKVQKAKVMASLEGK